MAVLLLKRWQALRVVDITSVIVLPDLDRLNVAEKDELLRELWPLRALVRQLSEQVAALTAKVVELEGRLALNSRNSSKPPSSGGYGKKFRPAKDAPDTDKKKSGVQYMYAIAVGYSRALAGTA